jgi:HSP20 family protein
MSHVLTHLAGDEMWPSASPWVEFPPVSVWTGQNEVKVVAEIPGMDPKNIEISVLGNALTISGERRPEDLPEGVQYHRQERGYGKFVRAVELPHDVSKERVEAVYRNGRLTVTLPKADEAKPRQITVKAE